MKFVIGPVKPFNTGERKILITRILELGEGVHQHIYQAGNSLIFIKTGAGHHLDHQLVGQVQHSRPQSPDRPVVHPVVE